jgi:EAL domain-containing protein (putative c-di-GMP-specific phosphodiesterase class I)
MINKPISFPTLQPIVDMHGITRGCEVLMRVVSESRILFPSLILSLFSPRDVVRIEEETHQKAFAIFRKAYTMNTTLFISINLCLSRWDKTLVSYIDKLSEDSNIPHSSIIVELSEVLYFSQDDYEFLDVISKLKENGVRIALDDFGGSIADIQKVCRIPFDFIKVNISLCKLTKFMRLLETLKNTDTYLVAEQVETKEDFALAKNSRFDFFQGKYCYKFCEQREQEKAV